jgi:hypothetical protein
MGFVLFKDSFERYDVGSVSSALLLNMLSRYTSVSGTLSIVSTGRTGQCARMNQASIGKVLPHSSRWVTGFAYRRNNPTAGDQSRYEIFNNDNQMCRLLEDSDGTLSIRAGNSNTIAVTDRSLNTGVWYYLELDVTLSGTTPITCTAELRINGHVEASGSGSTGFNAADNLSQDATGNYHVFSGLTGVGKSADFDDIYIKNEAGYEGDVRIRAAYPSGDGGTLQWTPESGTDHFAMVDTHPVDLTKWLETATPNDIDLWTVVLPSFSGSIVAVNISVLARKDDEGTKSFKIVVGPTGTDALSDEFFVSDVTPEYYEFSLKLDPTTGLAFVPGATITIGVKLIS